MTASRTGDVTNVRLAPAGQHPPVTSFVGREPEVAALGQLLQQPATRLVTITGAGGVGKTRLALAVAANAAASFADGLRFVPLAAVQNPNAVAAEIAAALGAQDADQSAMHEQLADLLGERSLLLVLDNFEHVLPAAPLLADLLSTCPGVTLLVTSRRPLQISGEYRFPVQGLDFPDAAVRDLAAIARSGAVQLFLARARMVEPGFALSAQNSAALIELCRRLSGNPLALELAAARLPLLPLPALVERLSPALPLLTGGSRDLPPRLRTMADAISWSHDLLQPAEAALFRHLCVCQGGFSLGLAEALGEAQVYESGGSSLTLVNDRFSALGALVDHALVQRENSLADEPRYTILEVVREYGAAKLAEHHELTAARQAHALWCTGFAEEAMAHVRGPDRSAWLRKLDLEQDNLRAALSWSISADLPEVGVRLAGALWWYWFHRGAWNEGRRWLGQALATSAGRAVSPASARAHLGAGMLAWAQGSYATAREHLTSSLACWRANPADPEIGYTLGFLSECLLALGEVNAARPHAEESLLVLDASSDRWGQGFARINLGNLARAQGEMQTATAHYETAVTILRVVGDPWLLALPLRNLARFALQSGNLARAETLQREALALLQEPEERWYLSRSFDELATIAAARGNARRAARLLGAAQSLRDAIGAPLMPHYQEEHARVLESVRAQLGSAFTAVYTAGSQLPLSKAIMDALADPERDPPQSPPPVLTPREHEVLRLLADGHTDRESAAMLCISPRTVEQHITNIVNKLGATSRLNAVLRAAHQGLV